MLWWWRIPGRAGCVTLGRPPDAGTMFHKFHDYRSRAMAKRSAAMVNTPGSDMPAPPAWAWHPGSLVAGLMRHDTRSVVFALLPLVGLSGCAVIERYQADRHIHRGEALLAAEDLEAALAEFEAAVELAPQLAVAHSRMGLIYRRMGEYERAVACFVAAVRYDPFSFSDTLNLAQLYHFMGRVKDAFDPAGILNPGAMLPALDLEQALERYFTP